MRQSEAAASGIDLEVMLSYLFSREFSGEGVPLTSSFDFPDPAPYSLVTLQGNKTLPCGATCPDAEAWQSDWQSSPHINRAVRSEQPEDSIAWLQNSSGEPFLLPCKYFGPDLIFVLRLETGELVWVVVQTKFQSNGEMREDDSQNAVKTVTPSRFFTYKVRYS